MGLPFAVFISGLNRAALLIKTLVPENFFSLSWEAVS
jgi:hypothetical protein